MRKSLILIFLLFVSFKVSAQTIPAWEQVDTKLFYTGGNVGIGKNNPLAKLDILGNIEMSTGVNPISFSYDTLGMNPVLNISVNAKEVDKRTYYRGAYFRIDTRTFPYTTPTFQWVARPPLSSPEKILMTLNEDGNLGIGEEQPTQKLTVSGSALIKGRGDEGNIRLTSMNGNWESNNLNLSYKNNTGFVETIGSNSPLILQQSTGNVGIGTTNPTKKLSVNGTILAKEVIISAKANYWPDYVFAENYQLKSLGSVKSFIDDNKHLPNIPSAEQIEENGISLGEIQKLQMEKIEELFLHIIKLEERIKTLEANI